ncbi:MAG: ADP-ribosyl-[dinitrogen reductase] hydrolase [Pseudomonadota bacterium]
MRHLAKFAWITRFVSTQQTDGETMTSFVTEQISDIVKHPFALQRAIAAYLGLAIGDALGATVEFMTPNEIRHQFAQQHGTHSDMIGGGWLRLKAGDITDDTEMSLAMGQAIIRRGGIDATSIAESFSAWMSTKPKDIGNTVRRGIVQYRRTGQTVMPPSEHDAGNGACMRCLPLALATWNWDWQSVQAASRLQAHITHHNAQSDAGTECMMRMVQHAMQGATLVELESLAHELVRQFPAFEYRKNRRENPSGYIVDTLQAVFQALFTATQTNFETALVDVVNRGGDADTTGAILGMVAGALYGVESFPPRWLYSLKANIRTQCIDQARALYQLAEQGHTP